jgi:hypothetical protein
MIHLSEEKLKELMAKAYEAGWYGVLELKDSAVEEICADFKGSSEYTSSVPELPPFNHYTYISSYIGSVPELQIQWNGG